MFRLISALKIRNSPPPWSNDHDLNRRYMKIVWDERNGAAIGRALMAWIALVGWIAFAAVILKGV